MLRNCIRENGVQGSLGSEDTGRTGPVRDSLGSEDMGENWSSAVLTGE